MKRSSKASRWLISLLAVTAAVCAGYQMWRFFNERYEVQTVERQVLSQSITVSGVAIRKETPLPAVTAAGVPVYQVADGTKLSKGMVYAEYYQNAEEAKNVRTQRSLQDKKHLLEQAVSDAAAAETNQTKLYNKHIEESLGKLADAVNRRTMSDLADVTDALFVSMNTKQIATGAGSNLGIAINRLQSEIDYYGSLMKSTPTPVSADKVGYFIRQCDGYEAMLDLDTLSYLTPEALESAMVNSPAQVSDNGGKLMTSHKWYYGAVVPLQELDKLWVGRELTLDFHVEDARAVPAAVYSLQENRKTDKAAVVFVSDCINSATVNLRFSQATVNFRQLTGLRVPKAALRFEGFDQGVYTVQGDNMIFRKVNILYEEDYTVLCQEVLPSDAERYQYALKNMDSVIVKGVGLYDGKAM